MKVPGRSLSKWETGKRPGWGSYPSFDMNEHDITQYLNMASDNAYEPGSVMKGITMRPH
ncbi:MAG: hypothetical protein ACLVJ6_01170 [Merdibacter sp.]